MARKSDCYSKTRKEVEPDVGFRCIDWVTIIRNQIVPYHDHYIDGILENWKKEKCESHGEGGRLPQPTHYQVGNIDYRHNALQSPVISLEFSCIHVDLNAEFFQK